MKKILVVDDRQEQRDAAIKALTGHEVITASKCADALKKIKENNFDVVLTDLMMPGEDDGLGPNGGRYVGTTVPYGFTVALFSLKNGVEKVAIVSNGQADDGNHHNHPILWACDSLVGTITDKLRVFAGYSCPHMDEKRLPEIEEPWNIKDWKKVLDILNGVAKDRDED